MTEINDRKPEGLPDLIRHYIDGQSVDSVDGDTFDVLDPVTNQPYIKAASGKTADVDKAVAAAKAAFETAQARRNEASKLIGAAKKAGDDARAAELMAEVEALKAKLAGLPEATGLPTTGLLP